MDFILGLRRWGSAVFVAALASISFSNAVFPNFDYLNVGYEFSRLFARIRADELMPECVYEHEKHLDAFVSAFSRNQSERPPSKCVSDFSLQCCKDLRLVCGDEGRERESLLLKLEKPETVLGAPVLASMLANPIYDNNLLERRKGFVKFLANEPELFSEFCSSIEEFKPLIESISTVMTCDWEKDSTCLLNGFFGVYWGSRTTLGFLPKKMSTQLKKLNSRQVKSKPKKSGLGDKIDKKDLLLNLSFGCATFVLAMNWLVQVSAWGKDVGETYNFEFAHQAKLLLRSKSFSEDKLREAEQYFFSTGLRDRLKNREALSDEDKKQGKSFCKSLESLIDDLKSNEKEGFEYSPNGVYKWFLTPRFRQQVEHELVLIKEGLHLKESIDKDGKKGYSFDPRVMYADIPRLVNRVLKPAYVVMAPIFILSTIRREARLYRIAVSRAKKEIADMAKMLKLCKRLISAVDKQIQARPEIRFLLSELDLFGSIRELVGHNKQDDFGSLIKALLEGVGRTPGKFLRVYKQLYQMRDRFRCALEAVGQIDAFLAITKLSQNPRFCFAEYLSESSGPKIVAQDFWDPQIGESKAIANSISLGLEDPRGMVITGSNAGGKSSFMRAVLCGSTMAQTFTVVPARSFSLTPFEAMFTLMSKKDDPGAGRSLFRVEAEGVHEFIEKVKHAKPGAPLLAALDEMFNSTGPDDAQALTRSVIDRVSKNEGVIAMIATHYPQVTRAEADTGGIFKNYKVTVERDEDGKFVKYKRKIAPGSAGVFDSTAMDVALMAGIDSEIVEMSKKIKFSSGD